MNNLKDDMIIVCLKGGLGNQMFQYAIYYKMKQMGKNVFLDLYLYKGGLEKRKCEIDLFENVSYCEASEEQCKQLRGAYSNFLEKVRRKFKLRKYYLREKTNVFYKDIFEYKSMYLDGYWQNENYFKDIKDQIFQQFCFSPIRNRENIELAEKIRNTSSVSVHIRRGDYLANKKMYGDLSNTDYYYKAIEYMKKRVDGAVFYIFSDDIEWVKKKFTEEKYIVVDNNNVGEFSYLDMQLMSICKHNIIANSSFSWWAAWLNNYDEKIVVAPSFWTKNDKGTNIICDSWIII